MNAIQEIKDRLAIEDVVAQYVTLKKAGKNLKGLCPFHAEKTPSFVVSPDRKIAYCFGCHKGGDVFRFVQEVEGVDFSDALKLLAERSGVSLDDYKPAAAKRTGSQKKAFIDLYDKATTFYEQQLHNTEDGKKVLAYLKARGLTDESISQFRLGFAPDSFDQTYTYLVKLGFLKKQLVSSGMAMGKDTTMERIYDRFRGRLMFPIRDHLGRTVAFGGRALKKEQEPKYMNSPETALYHKSRVLYGFYQGKQAIKQENEVIIVEGYMDVILAHQAGAAQTVAPCGTALVSGQLRLLKPFARNVVLAFDSDLAGQEAAQRAFHGAQEFDLNVKVLPITDGKDPADFIKEKGNEAFMASLKNSEPYGDFLLNHLLQAYGIDSLAAKRKVLQEFLPFFHSLQSSLMRDEYVRKVAFELDTKEVQIYDEIKKFTLPSYHPARQTGEAEVSKSGELSAMSVYDSIMGLMLEFPRIGRLFVERVNELPLTDDIKPIYKAFGDEYNGDDLKTAQDVIGVFPHELKEKAALLSLAASEYYGEMGEEAVEKELEALLATANKRSHRSQQQSLWKELKQAEKDQNNEEVANILKQLNELNRKAQQ